MTEIKDAALSLCDAPAELRLADGCRGFRTTSRALLPEFGPKTIMSYCINLCNRPKRIRSAVSGSYIALRCHSSNPYDHGQSTLDVMGGGLAAYLMEET